MKGNAEKLEYLTGMDTDSNWMNKYSWKNTDSQLDVVIARTFDQVESMHRTWEELESRQSYPITNSNLNRYLSVLRPQEDQIQPYVILFSKDAEPVAMVVARLEQYELKCKIGYKVVFKKSVRCLTVVYGGILGQPDTEICSAIVRELLMVLRRGDADIIFFNQLPIDSNMYKVVNTVPGFLYRSHFPEYQLHWQTVLSNNAGDSCKWVSKKHRHDIARCRRNLEKACSDKVKIVCYRQESDLDYVMDVVSHISASTYKTGLGVEFVKNPLTCSLLQQAARDGWLRAYIMYAGNEPIAFELGCVYGKVYFADQAGFNPCWRPYGPGIILQLEIFEQLKADNAVDTYDYGFGDAIYKRRFGSRSWPEVSVYVFAPRFYPVLLNLIDSSIRVLSLGLEFVIEKVNFTTRIKRYWRNYMEQTNSKKRKDIPGIR